MVHICTAIVSPNNLPKFRSYEPVLDAKAEATLIQEAQNGNKRSGSALHRQFHGQILRLAGEHVPPGSTIWTKKRQHTTELFDDLVAQGHMALWEAVLALDLSSGNRLWTLAVKRIAGAISDAAKQWRKGGIAGETRVDRWLLHNANATPARLFVRRNKFGLKRTFSSLEEAAGAIREFEDRYRRENYSTKAESISSRNGDDDDDPSGRCITPDWLGGAYSCFDPHSLSPQLRLHKQISRVIDDLVRAPNRRAVKNARRTESVKPRTGRVLPTTVKPPPLWCDDETWKAWADWHGLTPIIERKPSWRNTRTTTRAKSSPSPSRPTLQVRCGVSANKNFSRSATFAELRCSAI